MKESGEPGLKAIVVRSEEIDEIITSIPNWVIRSGISAMFFVLIILLLVGSFIKYPDTVKASVIITTTPAPLPLVTRTAGTLALLKRDNEVVNKDEVIAYVKSTTDFHHLIDLERRLKAHEARPLALELGELQPYYATFLNAEGNRGSFISNNAYSKQIDLLRKQIGNFRKLNRSLTAQRQIAAEELRLAHSKFRRDSLLYTAKVIAPLGYEEAQAIYLQQTRSFRNVEASITTNDIQINQLEKQVMELQLQKEIEANKLKLDYDNSLKDLLARIAKWKETYLFIAPMEGRVAYLGFLEDNGFNEAGKQIFSVLPLHGDVYAQAELPIAGSGKVKEGQTVNIRLENFPFEQFGMLTGCVKDISPLPTDSKYLVKIELGKVLLTTQGKSLPFKQQLRGETEIITEDLMLLERVFFQLRSIAFKN